MEIKAASLQIGYGDRIIVEDMDLHIAKNKITTIIGPNGSGKSTVLKAVTRLIKFQKGSVVLNDRDILELKPKELSYSSKRVPSLSTK